MRTTNYTKNDRVKDALGFSLMLGGLASVVPLTSLKYSYLENARPSDYAAVSTARNEVDRLKSDESGYFANYQNHLSESQSGIENKVEDFNRWGEVDTHSFTYIDNVFEQARYDDKAWNDQADNAEDMKPLLNAGVIVIPASITLLGCGFTFRSKRRESFYK